MQGTLSNRIKKLLIDYPNKIKLLMEWINYPEKRKDFILEIREEEIIISKNGK